jgi:small subunit ribosomal protein S20
MPHTPSAKKRLRQTAKRRLRNRSTKKTIRIQIKKLEGLAKQGPADQVQAELKQAIKKLDKAAARRVIHPNAAARKKSQLMRLARAQAQTAARS